MKTIAIRPARREDAETIAECNCRLAEETEDKLLDRETVERGVLAMFDEPGRGFYTVATVGDQVVGTIMITYEWSDWRNGNIWWIQSVYVVPELRRQGVFRQLFSHIREMTESNEEVCGLRLYVEENNTVAHKTYKNMGMDAAGYHVYERLG